jgi:Cu+-exporting ATPase
MAHMVFSWAPLHHPLVQLALSIPVYTLGLFYFGRSAYQSLRSGVPNMDVLIFIGAASALFYSVYGTVAFYGTHEVHLYLFYETGATIITLVLAGNLLEHRSVKKTTASLQSLSKLQPKQARVVQANGQLKEVPIENIYPGTLVQVNTGDLVPLDGLIQQGAAEINEQMLSGESLPVFKKVGDSITGGTIVLEGNVVLKTTATNKESVLSQIIDMVKRAQANKPAIQKLGDQVSAIFVPVVVGIALLTFLVSYFLLDLGSAQSMLRAVAVLVISCPCAMGLATPTAIMVGIGKAAKRGIIIKGGNVLENFAKTELIVFDKTGTLSTGDFKIDKLQVFNGVEATLKAIIFGLEAKSTHPIARSLVSECKEWFDPTLQLTQIEEVKGCGMKGYYHNQEVRFGKGNWVGQDQAGDELEFDLYLSVGNEVQAALRILDEAKPGAVDLINYLNQTKVETLMLSGDKQNKVTQLAKSLGMPNYEWAQLPAQKLARIEQASQEQITAMVGDGINDAPALSKVNVGISFTKASDIAIQTSSIIITHQDLRAIKEAHQISKMTYTTIKQNLFWAFFYNVLCIPLAAAGFMHPMLGAMSMAFSDIIVIGNSLRLGIRKLK